MSDANHKYISLLERINKKQQAKIDKLEKVTTAAKEFYKTVYAYADVAEDRVAFVEAIMRFDETLAKLKERKG